MHCDLTPASAWCVGLSARPALQLPIISHRLLDLTPPRTHPYTYALPHLAAAMSVHGSGVGGSSCALPTPQPSQCVGGGGLAVEPLHSFHRGRPPGCAHRRHHHGGSHHRRPTAIATGARHVMFHQQNSPFSCRRFYSSPRTNRPRCSLPRVTKPTSNPAAPPPHQGGCHHHPPFAVETGPDIPIPTDCRLPRPVVMAPSASSSSTAIRTTASRTSRTRPGPPRWDCVWLGTPPYMLGTPHACLVFAEMGLYALWPGLDRFELDVCVCTHTVDRLLSALKTGRRGVLICRLDQK